MDHLHISWLNIVSIIFVMHIIESYKAQFTRKFFLSLGLVFGQKIVLPARKLFPELALSPAHPEPGARFFGHVTVPEFEKFPVSLRFIASNTL